VKVVYYVVFGFVVLPENFDCVQSDSFI